MATVAGGIAQGLESGLRISNQFDDRRRLEEERARARQIQDEQLATQREDRTRRIAKEDVDRERSEDELALKALDDEGKTLASQFEGLVQQHGGYEAVPEEERTRLVDQQRSLHGRRRVLNEKRLRPVLERETKNATTLMQDIRRGTVKLEDVPDDQFYRAIGVVTKRDPTQLLRGDGGSELGNAVQHLLEQIETPSSPEELASAANIILEPELSKGIGEPGRDGSVITKKEIAKFVPSPDGKRMLPVLKVSVRRGDGAIGSYLAPVTEGRSSHGDDDKVVQLDLGDAMDHVGRLATLEELVNKPEVRAKIERGAQAGKSGVDEFRKAYSAIGGKPFKRKIKIEERKLGNVNKYITRDLDTGEQVGEPETEQIGIDPNKELTTEAMLRATGMRTSAQRDVATTRSNARGVGAKPMSEAERARAVRTAEEDKARDIGLSMDRLTGGWVDAKGKPANEDQRRAIAAAGKAVSERAAKQTRLGRETQQAPANPGERTIGQTYMTPRGPMIWRGQGWEPASGAAQ